MATLTHLQINDAPDVVTYGSPHRVIGAGDIHFSMINLMYEQTLRSTLWFLHQASASSGGYVTFSEDHGCLPMLIGEDGGRVYLYKLTEALDAAIDLDDIKADFPNLRYEQIAGAIEFHRKVAQFNVYGADVDAIEDELFSDDHDIEGQLQSAIQKRGEGRVLDYD